jgi:hypothetical protein
MKLGFLVFPWFCSVSVGTLVDCIKIEADQAVEALLKITQGTVKLSYF